MLFSQASCLLALIASVAAAPYQKRWGGWGGWGGESSNGGSGRPWWTPSGSSYIEFGKRFPQAGTAAPTCDLSQAVASMPTAPIPLPPPSSGLSLYQVVIGRGTQNYTCDLSNSTAVPAAVGAVASLFNVSCVAADSPDLLAQLPGIALNLPVPSSDDESDPIYQDMSGHHYFLNTTTPFFNMDTSLHSYGAGAFKKLNSTNAPSNAIVGQNNQGHGAVAWLKLDALNAEGQVFQEVYRLNTAGGSPPTTCTGQPAAFEVQYAAEYWLFS